MTTRPRRIMVVAFVGFIGGWTQAGGHFEWPLAIIGMTALVALFRFRVGIIPTIAACGAAGLIIRLLAG